MDAKLSTQEYAKLKRIIKDWLVNLNKNEKMPSDITALNFGLYEPYGIELVGAKVYEQDDDDWACEEDFVPVQRDCPDFKVSEDIGWEDFLSEIVKMLKELTVELKDLEILKVKHIATGFCDGDLVIVR